MSTAVMSSSLMFDCGDYFKTNGMARSAATTSVTTMTMPTAIGATSKEASQMLGALSAAQNPCLPGNTQSVRRSYSNLVNLIEQHRKLDRSVSEPTSRYKTELCRPFEESGSCKYGDKCQFAHGASELRNLARHPKYKTELCRTFHKIGFCPYGPRCHFVHNFEEARIHNLKVSAAAAAAAAAATGTLGLGPLLQPLSVSAALLEQLSPTTVGLSSSSSSSLSSLPGTNSNNRSSLVRANSLGLTASHSVAAAAAAAAAAAQLSQLHRNTNNAGSDRFNSSSHRYSNANSSNTANCTTSASLPLHRSNSLGLPDQQHGLKPTPLNLSPTFSLGSAADSISPSSSLSQSPTNSMSSFFSDETSTSPLTLSVLSNNNVASATAATTSSNINLPTTAATATVFTNFGQDLGGSLLFGSGSSCSSSGLASPPPQSPSPPLSSRTQSPISPISPNTESRLPIFNKISNNVFDKFDNLKI